MDDPFASLGYSVEPEAISGPAADPFALLGRDLPALKAAEPLSIGGLLRFPGKAIPALGARLYGSYKDSFQNYTSGGVLGGVAGDALVRDFYGREAMERERAYQRRNRPAPAGNVLEGVTDFAGALGGQLIAPETRFMPGAGLLEKVGITSPITQKALAAGAYNAATDPAFQAAAIARKQQERYDPFQTLGATVLGVGAGAGFHAAGATQEATRDVGRALHAAIPGEATPRPVKPQWQPYTVGGLWDRLEKQESGGDQSAVSEKGAVGVAQLMPDTARWVARQIGRPDFGEIALEDSPRGKAANRQLGQMYLAQQMHDFGNDPVLALAAYNAGPERVHRWLERFGTPDQIGRGRWVEMIPFDETRNYVRSILGHDAGPKVPLVPHELDARAEMGAFEHQQEPQAAPITSGTVKRFAEIMDEVIQNPQGDTAKTLEKQLEDLGQDLEKELEEAFPGAKPEGSGEHVGEDIPWDDEPAPPAATPEAHQTKFLESRGLTWDQARGLDGNAQEALADEYEKWLVKNRLPREPVAAETAAPAAGARGSGHDIIDIALDHMRSGKRLPREGEGETLAEALTREGGLKDADGELGRNGLDLESYGRKGKMLRKVNGGMSLDDAARWAWERGYFGAPEARERPIPDELIAALRDEFTGTRRLFPAMREDAVRLRETVDSLEAAMAHLGLDPNTHTNAQIREALDRYFQEPEHFPDEELVQEEPGALGMKASRDAPADHGTPIGEHMARLGEIMSTTRGGLTGARKPRAIPAPDMKNLPKVEGIPRIARNLLRRLDLLRRQGRVGMRGALGTYNRTSGMIRTKGAQELDVVAHEIGHAIEHTKQPPTLLAVMKKWRSLLKDMDYDQSLRPDPTSKIPHRQTDRRRPSEGFAEFFRWYVTNPEYARKRAGAFYDEFEAAMDADSPKDLVHIQAAQRAYQAFLDAPSVSAARAMVVGPEPRGLIPTVKRVIEEKGPIGAAQAFGDEIYRGLIDHLHPWQMAVRRLDEVYFANTGKHLDLKTANNPYELLRQLPAIAAVGHMDLVWGVHGYHSLQVESPGLTQALEKALGERFLNWDPKAIHDFGTYLVGRRATHLYDRYAAGLMEQPPDILSQDFWRQTTADLELANPTWSEAADLVYEFTRAMWKKRFEGGLLKESAYLQALEDHPEYVPLFRDVSDREQVGGRRGDSTQHAGGVIRLQGSDRAYMNPIHSLMQMAYELNAGLARNDAMVALDDLGRRVGPDGGQVVERLPANEIERMRVDAMQVFEAAAKDIGVDEIDRDVVLQSMQMLFGDEAITHIYRAKPMTPKGHENVVWAWRDGEAIPLLLPDGQWGRHMVESLAGATPQLRSLALEMAAIPARVLRAGITAHPSFFLANWFRDQLTASVLTDVGYLPFYHGAKGAAAELAQGDLSRLYNVASGEIGGMQSAAEHMVRADRDVQGLRRKGLRIRHFTSWQALARATEVSESGTRLGIFDAARRKYQAQGFSEWEALKEASFEARDYMDFDRHGGWVTARLMIRMIPFFNAGLQALDKTARVGGGVFKAGKVIPALFGGPQAAAADKAAFSHAMKLWTVAATLAAGSMALRAAYKNNPEYEEIADYLRATHWVVPLPDGHYAVIPKPYDIAALSNVMERAYEGVALKDPTSWGRLAHGLYDITVPNLDAPMFGIPIGVFKNRDSSGIPIVPDRMKGMEARDQVREDTGAAAKGIAAATGIAPAVADYLLKSIGGSWGREVSRIGVERAPIEGSAADTFALSRFVKDWTRGSTSSKQFWDLVASDDGDWAKSANSFNAKVLDTSTSPAVIARRLQEMEPEKRAYVMMQTFLPGQAQQLHPLGRAQEAVHEISSLAQRLRQGDVVIPTEHGLQPLRLTPVQRRAAVDGLHKLAVAEQQNALIAAGVKGWSGTRQPLPAVKYAREVEKAAPGVMQALSYNMGLAGVLPPETMHTGWGQVRGWATTVPDQVQLNTLIQMKRYGGAGAAERLLSQVVPAQ